MKPARIFILTLLAMIAFAGNSLLCRAALKQTRIDAASFTFVRIFSGAAALWLIMKMRGNAWKDAGNWSSALALFAYAAAFSFAYNSLAAGTGALLLFGAVQAIRKSALMRNCSRQSFSPPMQPFLAARPSKSRAGRRRRSRASLTIGFARFVGYATNT